MMRIPYYPDDIPEEVCDLFIQYCNAVIAKGRKRYSSAAIIQRIRWHQQIEKGDADFKVNNNWTPILARWAMKIEPRFEGMFELRNAVGKQEELF